MDAAFVAATLTLLIAFQGAVRGDESLCPKEPVEIHLSRGQKVTISYHTADGMEHDVEEVPAPTRRPFGPSRTPSTNAPLDTSTVALDPYEANATSTTPPQPETTTTNAAGDQIGGVASTTLAGQDKEATVDIDGVNETETTASTTTSTPLTSLVNSVETEGDVYSVFNVSVRDTTATSETTSDASGGVKGEQTSILGEDLTTQSTTTTTTTTSTDAAALSTSTTTLPSTTEQPTTKVQSETTLHDTTTPEATTTERLPITSEVSSVESDTTTTVTSTTTERLPITSEASDTTTTITSMTTEKLPITSEVSSAESDTTTTVTSTTLAVDEIEETTLQKIFTTIRSILKGASEDTLQNDQVDDDIGGEEFDELLQELNATNGEDKEEPNIDDTDNVGGEDEEEEFEEEVESSPSTPSTPTSAITLDDDDDSDFNQTQSPLAESPTIDFNDYENLNSTNFIYDRRENVFNSTISESQTSPSTANEDEDDDDDSEKPNLPLTPMDDRDQSLLANLTNLTLTNNDDDYESLFENETISLNTTNDQKINDEDDEDEIEDEDEDEDEVSRPFSDASLDTDLVKSILPQIVDDDNTTTQESRDPRELENEALEGDIYPDDGGNFGEPEGEVAHADDSTPQFYEPNQGGSIQRRIWDEPVSQYLPQRSKNVQGPRADRWRRQLLYHVQPNTTECEWRFKTDPGVPLMLSFKNYSIPVSAECNLHHISVKRITGYVARWCGDAKGSPSHATFARDELRLVLRFGPDAPSMGFVAEVHALDKFLLRKAVSKVRPLFTSSSSN